MGWWNPPIGRGRCCAAPQTPWPSTARNQSLAMPCWHHEPSQRVAPGSGRSSPFYTYSMGMSNRKKTLYPCLSTREKRKKLLFSQTKIFIANKLHSNSLKLGEQHQISFPNPCSAMIPMILGTYIYI